jgi:hypothetical protein
MSLKITGGLSFLDGELTVNLFLKTISYAPTDPSAAGAMGISLVHEDGHINWTWKLSSTPTRVYDFSGKPNSGGYKGMVSGPPPTETPGPDVDEIDPWQATAGNPVDDEGKKSY